MKIVGCILQWGGEERQNLLKTRLDYAKKIRDCIIFSGTDTPTFMSQAPVF